MKQRPSRPSRACSNTPPVVLTTEQLARVTGGKFADEDHEPNSDKIKR